MNVVEKALNNVLNRNTKYNAEILLNAAKAAGFRIERASDFKPNLYKLVKVK